MWLQTRGRPVRGWLVQQLIKLAVAEVMTQDVLVHADSDVVLLRPFLADSVADDAGRVRLYRLPGAIDERLPNHIRWHRSAEKLVGIEHAGFRSPTSSRALSRGSARTPIAAVTCAGHEGGTGCVRWRPPTTCPSTRSTGASSPMSSERPRSGPDLGVAVPRLPTSAPLSDDELTAFLDGVGPESRRQHHGEGRNAPSDYVEALERRWAAVRMA